MNFQKRSLEKELLDADNIPTNDLYRNLYELHSINTLLGGYRLSLKALQGLTTASTPLTIVDIGSGGGDMLKTIYDFATQKNYNWKLYGVDLKDDCIRYSQENAPNHALKFIADDYRNVLQYVPKVDVLHACLFCHHLTDEQIIDLFTFCKNNRITLIVNDLHRHWLAYYGIKILTRLFSKSYLVKNDAPLSVLRGFTRSEWLRLLERANITEYSLSWQWAFRYTLIIH